MDSFLIARRLTALLVLLALVISGAASAQAVDSRSVAEGKCNTARGTITHALGGGSSRCQDYPDPSDSTQGVFICEFTNPSDSPPVWYGCNSAFPTHVASGYPYSEVVDCSTRSDQVGGWYVDSDPTTSDNVCNEGCMMIPAFDDSYGGVPAWSATGDTCTAEDAPDPEDDTDNDGTPDDDDAFPSDPNESEDTDGDGTGDNSDTSPDDEENGADDGEGDESDNVAAGGGTCGAPPSCSGDGIQCNQLFQQWRTRCNTEGAHTTVAGAGGDCAVPLVCTGDVIQCAQLRETRATRCAAGVEDEAPESVATTGGEGASPGDTDVVQDHEIGVADLDSSGWLARTCPSIPEFELGALGNYTPEIPRWCELLDVIGGLIMLIAAWLAIKILGA